MPLLIVFFCSKFEFALLFVYVLSIGGKISLQFCATDGKKLTPSDSTCQILSKKNSNLSGLNSELVFKLLYLFDILFF